MPALIPVAIGLAAGIGAAAAGVGTITVLGFAISLAQVIGTVVSIAASLAIGAITSKPKAARPTNTGTTEDRKQIIRGSVEPRQIIYGYARVGGAIVYAASSGDNLRYLHLVVVVATHQVAAIPIVWLNSQLIRDSDCDGAGNITRSDHPLVGKVRIEKYLGNQTTGSSTLASESPDGWSSTHALRGCAYIYIRLEYDQEKMPGLQAIEAEVQGKADIYDPRSTSSAYTDNWALCVLDYLRSPFGLACSDDEIDYASFVTAANLSDENVQITAEGTTQARFVCSGSFKLDRAPIDVMEALLSAGSGALCYVAGQYRLYGGSYTTPTASLGISDFAGELEVTPRAARRELFNGVRGTFIDPERGYQPSEFGAVFDTGYDAQDGGERVWRDVEFAFTNNNIRAQRLARTVLLRARQSLRIKAPVKFSALRFCVWQMLYVTHPDLGLSAKPMRVIGWEYEPNTGVVMVELQAEAASGYAWLYDYAYNQPSSPDTTLIDPLALPTPAPPSLAATTVLADDGAIVPAIAITWAAVAHAFVSAMEVQWRVNTGVWNTAFVPVGTTRFDVRPAIVGGSYEARIRATSQFGRSAWSNLSGAVSGAADSTVPSAPTGISSVGGIRTIRVLWNAVTTRDVDRYRVYERLNSGSAWYIAAEPYSTDFVRAGLQPGEAREFQVSAIDRSGNEGPKSSVTGASASLLIAADIQDGILNTAKFAASIEPVGLFATTPGSKTTNTIFNTTDNKLYRWTGTAYTAAIPAVDVVGQLTNSQIADLDAAKLSGTMNVARIADGALADTKLKGGVSGNQIWNSCAANGLTGWVTSGSAPPTSSGSTKGSVLGAALDNWRLSGFGSGYMTRASMTSGQYMDVYWQPGASFAGAIPVTPYLRYEFQARLLPIGVSACVVLQFYTAAEGYISELAGNSISSSSNTDGKTLGRYTRSYVLMDAPGTAAFAIPVIRAIASGTVSNPTLIFSQALFGEARVNQTDPSVWSPGAMSDGDPAIFPAASITDALLNTGISAAKITGALSAASIAASGVSGVLALTNIPTIPDAKIGDVSPSKLSAVLTTSNFDNTLRPPERLATLPTTGNFQGRLIFLTSDNKLYRYDGSAFISTTAAADVSGTLLNAQIASGLDAAKLTLGTLDVARVADGALADAKLKGGNGANTIWNSCAANGLAGWYVGGTAAPATTSGSTKGAVLGGSTDLWRLAGFGSGYVAKSSVSAGAYLDLAWYPNGQPTAVQGTLRYEFQALVIPKGLAVELKVAWYDGVGAYLSETSIGTASVSSATAGGLISNYTRVFGFATAPGGAVSAVPVFRLSAASTTSNVSLVFSRAMFCEARSNQTDPSVWSPGALSDGDPNVFAAGSIGDALVASGLDAAKLAGTIAEARLASIAASKVTGQLTDVQIAALDAAKLSGTIAEARLASLDASKLTGTIAEARLASIAASKVTGQLTNAQLADLAATKVTGQITETQITDSAITTVKLAAGSVVAGKIAADTITSNEIAANAITTAELASGAVTTAKLVAGAVTANEIASGSITTAKLAVASANVIWNSCCTLTTAGWSFAGDTGASGVSGLVAAVSDTSFSLDYHGSGVVRATTAPSGGRFYASWNDFLPVLPGQKVQIAAMLSGRLLASMFVGVSFFGASGTYLSESYGNSLSAQNSTGAQRLDLYGRSSAVVTVPANAYRAQFFVMGTGNGSTPANLSFTQATYGLTTANATEVAAWEPGGVTRMDGGQIITGSIFAAQIAAGTITAAQIAADTITAGQIAANAITAGELAAGAVTTAKLAAGAVTANEIAALTITAAQIAADTITAAQIAANAITTSELAAGAVTAAKITAGTITANEIAGRTITAGLIATGTLTANELAANSVTATQLQAGSVLASKVVIQPQNLNLDPTFADVAYWSNGFPASGSSSTGWWREAGSNAQARGTTAGLVLWSGAGFTSTAVAIAETAITYGLRPASKYTLRCRGQNTHATQTLAVIIFWYDATGTYLSSHQITVPAGTISAAPFTLAQITPPANGYGYRISIRNSGGSAFSGTMSVGAIEFFLAADADLIVDGAIVAGKIAALSIVAGDIASNAIIASKIGAGEIVAGKLATDAVVATNIAAGQVTAGKLAAGSVSADNIQANAIRAQHVLISGNNMVLDADFTDATYWSNLYSGTGSNANLWVRETGVGPGSTAGLGSASAVVMSGGWHTGTGDIYMVSAQRGGIVGGQKLRLQARGYNPSNSTMRVFVQYYNSAGGYLSSGTNSTYIDWAPGAAASTQSVQITVPQDAETFSFIVQKLAGSAFSGYMALVDPQLIPAAEGTLIVDGAISATKIGAGQVSADKLSIGAAGQNVCWNSLMLAPIDAYSAPDGWSNGGDTSGTGFATTLGVDSGAGLLGARVAFIAYTGSGFGTSSAMYAVWAPKGDWNRVVAVTPGQRMQASAYVQTVRCDCYVELNFFDAAGSPLGAFYSGLSGVTGDLGRSTLSSFTRIGVLGTAPAGSVYARAYIRAIGLASPSTDPYCFFTHFMFGRANPLQVVLDDFQPGGATEITGGLIRTDAIQARMIQANAVAAGKIAADAVTAREVVAGAITTAKLAVASSNEIWNGCCTLTTAGWNGYSEAGGGSALTEFASCSTALGEYFLAGVGTGYMRKTGTTNGPRMLSTWNQAIPVTAGKKYQIAALLNAHRCTGYVILAFFTSAGAYISESISSTTTNAYSGGTSESQYTRVTGIVTAPSGAAYAYFSVCGLTTNQDGPYLFFTKCMAGEAPPNATEVAAWAPGGVTRIDGGQIVARSIIANQIAADTLTGNEIAANTITASEIASRTITADRIATGAITANELSANSVTAAQIQAGAVTASKVVIRGGDLVFDPQFDDSSYWLFDQTGGWFFETGVNLPGARRYAAIWDGYTTGTIAYGMRSPRLQPVSEGQVLRLRCLGRTVTASKFTRVVAEFLNSSGTSVSAPGIALPTGTNASAPYEVQVTVPSTATHVRPAIFTDAGVAWNGFVAVSDISIQVAATAALIVDGAIVAGKVAANAITTGNLAAGAVTTEKLAVGSGNIIWNSCCTITPGGWSAFSEFASTSYVAYIYAAASSNPGFALQSLGSGDLYSATSVNGQRMFAQFDTYLPVQPGKKIQVSALLSGLNVASSRVEIVWTNSGGAYISETVTPSITAQNYGNAQTLDAYALSAAIMTVPSGCYRAYLRVAAVANGSTNCHLWFSQVVLAPAPDNATEVAAWAPGGVTRIDGGQIATDSITSVQIAANAITSNELAANSVIAGKIQAGAISATEIAAGAIVAANLASSTLITSAGQLGTAVIGTAQIGDLTVNRIKVVNGAIGGSVSATASVSATVTPPANSTSGSFSTGFNYVQLVTCSVTVGSNENGLLVVFPDSNTDRIISEVSNLTYGE